MPNYCKVKCSYNQCWEVLKYYSIQVLITSVLFWYLVFSTQVLYIRGI